MRDSMVGYYRNMQYYQQKANERNIEALKRVCAVSEETKGIAINTNLMVHEQGQKLQRIEGKLDTINGDLRRAETTAKEISSFWYSLKMKVKRTFGMGSKVEKPNKYPQSESVEDYTPAPSQQPGLVCEILDGQQQNQEDELIDQIIENVRAMKRAGRQLGVELDRQTPMLTNIDAKMDRANVKMTKVNRILKKQLL